MSSPVKSSAQLLAGIIWRTATIIEASTNSLTAFAFAPGVLNTTTPSSVKRSTGILLTPAPARETPIKRCEISISFKFSLRKIMASGFSVFVKLNPLFSRIFKPSSAIALYTFTSVILFLSLLHLFQSLSLLELKPQRLEWALNYKWMRAFHQLNDAL